MILTVEESWPDTIPLPFFEFNGAPINASISSPNEQHKVERRSRRVKSFQALGVRWILTPGQYTDFREFFYTNLGNGAARFSIQLRYPKNSTLDDWDVRFTAGWKATHMEGLWQVEAQLDLVQKMVIDAGTGTFGSGQSGDSGFTGFTGGES